MNGFLTLLLACVASRFVIFGLDQFDIRKGPSLPLQLTALVVSLLTGIAPLLAIHFGWVEQSGESVIVAGVAFFYFSGLRRDRFINRIRQKER